MAGIRVALMGCGNIQARHARTFMARSDAEIVALCDVGVTACERFAERMEMKDAGLNPPHYDDAAKMYDQVKPDAVSICTPHTMHYDHGMAALDAGCHVLMEKPMVTDAGDAYRLAEKVKERGKIFVVGYNTPCTPEFEYLRNLIRTQELGKLELVSGYLSQNWLNNTAGKWRQDPKLSGGGQAYDSGAHPLASLTWSVESRVAEVFAFIDNHGTAVDINSSINIRFESGVFASVVISGNCPVTDAHMTFIFDNGKVDINPWHADWIKVWKGKQVVKYPPIEGEPTLPADNFLDAIQGRAQARTTPHNGIIHSELMDGIYESAQNNRPSKVGEQVA